MAHYKGALAINPWRDIPLLRQIRDSAIISHSQLFRFMSLGHYESRRDVFNWRLRRLVQHGFIRRLHFPHICTDYLYSISSLGRCCLEQHGDFYILSGPALVNTRCDPGQFPHDLQLNEIHLALLQSGILRNWIPERKLRSLLDQTRSPYVKTYDAVVDVNVGVGQRRFALEYEQSQKETRRYLEVREALEQERTVDLVLYLLPTRSLVANVSRHFQASGRRICFALTQEFKQDLLEAHVWESREIDRRPFSQVLLAAPSQLGLALK